MPPLHRIIAPTVLAAFSALQLGAAYRIAEHAWQSTPVGVIDDDDTFLAMVARTTSAEWSAVRPAVLRALGSHAPHGPPPTGSPHDPAGATAGHLVLQAVRDASHAPHATASATPPDVGKRRDRADLSAKRREAGRAGAAARWQTDGKTWQTHGKPMANAILPSSGALSLRSTSSESASLALHRSKEQSAMQSAPEDVIASLSAGARALGESKIQEWRRTQSLRMLQDAITRWRANERTTFPVTRAGELADSAHASPERVDFVIETIEASLKAAAVGGDPCNPVAMLMSGLGLSARSRGIPWDVPILVSNRWATRETQQADLLKASAAVQARLNQLRQASAQQAGGSPAARSM